MEKRVDTTKRTQLKLAGRVQGIGFRPAVYRLANALGLAGFIYNDTAGVTIEVQGRPETIEKFIEQIKAGNQLPATADIKSIDTHDIKPIVGETRFIIQQSDATGAIGAQVTADMATCGDCLREMRDKNNFRYRYPFINCTNCGPRYSIVKTIPYDRPNTTMSVFAMCDKCAAQYKDVNDRRFHAQPVACPQCGPRLSLCDNTGKEVESDSDKIILRTADALRAGKIVAVKGIGGFHLAVNALDNEAVMRLRQRKRRDAKPLAMMSDSVEKIRRYAIVDDLAERVLKSPEAPIVLLPKKENCEIAPDVAAGVNSFGFMLCYTPLHWLLFDEGLDALVMTSGNIADEPLICRNDEAIAKLGDIADLFLLHDREIYRQVDDSLVHFIDGQAVLLRRARGYVPTPIIVETKTNSDIFAAGADMKNTFCFAKGKQLIVSEHIGDLEDADVYHHYVDSISHLAGLFDVKPKVAVCDLHPAYFSSQYAASIKNAELIKVQHHWAHIASVLAEHGLDEKVIGIECDGTGYGTDGAVWGCEFLIADLHAFERFGHLMYYPLAGGDLAAKEAIRPTLGLLSQAYGEDFILDEFDWLLEKIEPSAEKQKLILQQIRSSLNTVNTSSLGRVFDCAAALAGLGGTNNFEAQLPMALESAIIEGCDESYDFDISDGDLYLLDIRPMIKQIIADVRNGTNAGVIAAKFHNGLTAGLCEMAKKARKKTGLNRVALSGGVFCNRYLTNRLIRVLKRNDFTVLFNRLVPANDGGIALGQIVAGRS